ncbi:MAG: exodeoxyribonuclease VII large subunit [Spirochaetales bacterium]|nr:exodeoxyribonuclease VII large subunit [Spirochaetales bacterium]
MVYSFQRLIVYDFSMIDSMNKVYSVSEIISALRSNLKAGFGKVRVEGEISNFRPSSAGHMYFSLKDSDSLINVVMFRSDAQRLDFELKEGLQITAEGSIDVYSPRGRLQLICRHMEQAGIGKLLALLEERKHRLAREGFFEEEKKKPIPVMPKKAAVITSPTGAAIRDILRVLRRRNSGLHLIILPSLVQGDSAAAKLAEQLRVCNRYQLADVVILSRGGGSVEDLLPFSDESLIREIARSRIPVISAVGHEVDIALSDLAADLRAPTPSAAAELVSKSRDELRERLSYAKRLISRSMKNRIERIRMILDQFSGSTLRRSFNFMLQPFYQQVDETREAVKRSMQNRITGARHRLVLATRSVEGSSPQAIMKRGYAVIFKTEGNMGVRSVKDTCRGEKLRAELYDGRIFVQTESTEQTKTTEDSAHETI